MYKINEANKAQNTGKDALFPLNIDKINKIQLFCYQEHAWDNL